MSSLWPKDAVSGTASTRKRPAARSGEALDTGALDPGRFKSYQKLQREMRFLARRQDQKLRQAEKAKWKKISQWQKALEKDKQNWRP